MTTRRQQKPAQPSALRQELESLLSELAVTPIGDERVTDVMLEQLTDDGKPIQSWMCSVAWCADRSRPWERLTYSGAAKECIGPRMVEMVKVLVAARGK